MKLSVSVCVLGALFVTALILLTLSPSKPLHSELLRGESLASTVILVPGGGLTPGGEVPVHTKLRLDAAYSLYKQSPESTIIVTLSGGTPHKPNPVDAAGFPVFEAAAAARALINMGTPSSSVFEECFSLDTIGNAYFARVSHVDRIKPKEVVVITNSWHMPRTKAIFDIVFNLKDSNEITSPSYSMKYFEVDSGLEKAADAARTAREAASLEGFKSTLQAHKWANLSQLYYWIFTQHSAYSTSRISQNAKPNLPPAVLSTY